MSERNYSDVVWPWDDDPNWAAPREGATSDPANSLNWALECQECALRFPSDIMMMTVEAHFQEQHGAEKVHLNLVWVGLGSPPKASS